MRQDSRSAGVLLCALLGAACSATPHGNPAPTAVAPTPGRTGGAADASGHAPAIVNGSLVRQGYRATKRGDQVLYCRSQSVTGTSFPSTVCLTERQIKDRGSAVQRSRDALNSQGAAHCVGGECGGASR
jgi:hypothetical protein